MEQRKINKINKRGMFFTLDAFIGLTILLVGGLITYYNVAQEPPVQPGIGYAEDVMAILTKTHFKDMNLSLLTTPDGTAMRLLIQQNIIYDLDKTVLAQIGEFYYLSELTTVATKKASYKQYIQKVIAGMTIGAVPRIYGWKVRINSEEIYTGPMGTTPESDSKLKFVSQQLAFGTYKQKTLYGPYLVEVIVWG